MKLQAYILIIGLIIVSACKKDDTNSRENDAAAKLNTLLSKYGLNESHKVSEGIYINPLPTNIDSLASVNDIVVIDYYSEISDGTVVESTDSSKIDDPSLRRNDIMWGPHKKPINESFKGLQIALQNINEGTTVDMVIDHSLLFNDFEPRYFNMTVKEIVKNDSAWDKKMFNVFADEFVDDTWGAIAIDSSGFAHMRYKITSANPLGDSINIDDTLSLEITGQLAEVEGIYSPNTEPRYFFPYGAHMAYNETYVAIAGDGVVGYGESANRDIRNQPVPWCPAIDSLLIRMKYGETATIVSTSLFGYWFQGFINSYQNIYLVWPYTPVTFTITTGQAIIIEQ